MLKYVNMADGSEISEHQLRLCSEFISLLYIFPGLVLAKSRLCDTPSGLKHYPILRYRGNIHFCRRWHQPVQCQYIENNNINLKCWWIFERDRWETAKTTAKMFFSFQVILVIYSRNSYIKQKYKHHKHQWECVV